MEYFCLTVLALTVLRLTSGLPSPHTDQPIPIQPLIQRVEPVLAVNKSDSTPSPDEEEYGSYLPKGYNKQAAPVFKKLVTLDNGTVITIRKPVTCTIYLNIKRVKDIDDTKEEVTLIMDLAVGWQDGEISRNLLSQNVTPDYSRNAENMKPFSQEFLDKLWLPDLQFEEAVAVARPVVLDKGATAYLFNRNTGILFVRSRMLLTLECGMDFKHYPADQQKCQFHILSAALGRDDVDLVWNSGKFANKVDTQGGSGVYLHETTDPNFDYQVSSIKKYYAAPNFGPETRHARPHSYLWFEIRIRRKMSYHLLQTYLPSVFFLVVTWLCFLIPSNMFEARVGVTMTTLLTQTSMFSSIRENTPVVGYVKAIDTWMVTCIAFIFLALCAFTTGAWMSYARRRMLKEAEELEANVIETGNLKPEGDKASKRTLKMYGFVITVLNKYTAPALSLSFLLFAILYWSWLLSDSEYLEWNVNKTLNCVD